MAATTNAQIPQGFSVYQPMLGAPLQFFPALGSKELDDMVDAYIAGPASVKDKRASVSVDFLEYAQRTGQTFKFYAVPGMMAAAESPMASPFQGSTASSINASPIASSWDWAAVSAPTPSSSARAAKSSRTGSAASSRRSAPSDFAHLPGMKILTKDGTDVTNSASRGSKTKEQRDHAHLMRIIKACDSCKKKKIRCDPSHKKRSVAPQPAKVTKKAPRTTAAPAVAAPQPDSFPVTPSFDLDSSFTSPELENFDIDNLMKEPWEDFIQYPAADEDPNYDFFLDPQGFFSQPLDQQAISSTSNSPFSWSDEQFNAYTSSSSDLNDYGLVQSTSASTSPSTLDLDASTLPPDMPPSRVPRDSRDQNYIETQPQSVAMPDLYQPAAVGFGPERYATLRSQYPADGESQSTSSTESSRTNASPLGGAAMTNSWSPEERYDQYVETMAVNKPESSSSRDNVQSTDSSLEGVVDSFTTHVQRNSRSAAGHNRMGRVTTEELAWTHEFQQMVRSSDLDHTPGADSSGVLPTRRGLASVDESSIERSSSAPLSARMSGVADAHVLDTGISGTDCSRSANGESIAPHNSPATGTDCLGGMVPLQTVPNTTAGPLTEATLRPQLNALPHLGSLSGQTSSSLVLASATLYGALDMLLSKQQKRSVLDKGRRKDAGGSGSSWLATCGKLAIIPLATVLATGFLPGWSFVG